jgi:hypothetical protein
MLGAYLLVAAVSACITMMLDPAVGRRRRAMTRDRLTSMYRRSSRRLSRWRRGVGATTHAYSQRATHLNLGGRPAPDDVTLTQQVEGELVRHSDIPKGRISVDAAEGVVTLRGQLDRPEQIEEAERAVQRMHGVQGVHNFLHLGGTPAPNKAAAREAVGAGNGWHARR